MTKTSTKLKWFKFAYALAEKARKDDTTIKIVTGSGGMSGMSLKSINPKLFDKLKAEGKVIELDEGANVK